MTHLLAFHLGPVQDFIAAARRTQDLWIGSWLLSHLSRAAIKEAVRQGAALVVPAALPEGGEPSDAGTTNHFVARIDGGEPQTVAREAEAAVIEEWERIEGATRRAFFGDPPDETAGRIWSRQVGSFLEIYWALVAGDGGGAEPRRRAQEALDARKRLRDFQQVEEPHLKCTLCGQRQELSGKEFVGDARRWWDGFAARHSGRFRVRANERLCAVCAVKRGALMAGALSEAGLRKSDRHFPSTSGVAAATFKKKLLANEGAGEKLGTLLKVFQDMKVAGDGRVDKDSVPELAHVPSVLPPTLRDDVLTLDGDLFYPETFKEGRLMRERPTAFYEGGEAATRSLRELYAAVGMRPSKYFAALKMDGDRMGEFFGKADEHQARALSLAVTSFSREAREIVRRRFGRLVYAGGDDALALLPLEEFLPCARELQEGFKTAMGGLTVPEGLGLPTPSVGAAVAHHTAPLDLTLLAMQHAERSAKNTYGRDALCVHILRRSGEEIRIGTRWTLPGGKSLVAIAERAASMLAEDSNVLSMKFPYSVATEARALETLPRVAREAELNRLARRHKGRNFAEKAAGELAGELAEWSDSASGPAEEGRALGLVEVARWLLLARFIAAGGRDEE